MKHLKYQLGLLIMALFLLKSLHCIQDDIIARMDVPEEEVPNRPLPPEFADFIDDKELNTAEGRMLDCMHDFKVCMAVHTYQPFCAVNVGRVLRYFGGMCELTYENCKAGGLYWQYLSDEDGVCPNATVIDHS